MVPIKVIPQLASFQLLQRKVGPNLPVSYEQQTDSILKLHYVYLVTCLINFSRSFFHIQQIQQSRMLFYKIYFLLYKCFFFVNRTQFVWGHMWSFTVRTFMTLSFTIIMMFSTFWANNIFTWTKLFNMTKFPAVRAQTHRKYKTFYSEAASKSICLFRASRTFKTNSDCFTVNLYTLQISAL